MRPVRFIFTFCILGFFFLFGDQPSSTAFWWTIEINAVVSGTYRVEKKPLELSGNYRFRINCQGSMERDNGDYILYQGEKSVEDLKWHEKRGDQSLDLELFTVPGFKLNYVIRKQGGVYLDFEMFPVVAGGTYLPVKILLPCSDENSQINLSSRYNHYIEQGSNVIGVDENRLYRDNQIVGSYRWQWGKKEKDGRQDHSIELKLSITRKQK